MTMPHQVEGWQGLGRILQGLTPILVVAVGNHIYVLGEVIFAGSRGRVK